MPKLSPFYPQQGWLKDGRIPAATICPFRIICTVAQEGMCKHKSQEATEDFSCASARAFSKGLDYNTVRRSHRSTGGGG
jgi:hypothetical protein